MAFRETSANVINRLNQLSLENPDIESRSEPKVPVPKASFRKDRRSFDERLSPGSGASTAVPCTSVAPRQNFLTASLTTRWFEDTKSVNNQGRDTFSQARCSPSLRDQTITVGDRSHNVPPGNSEDGEKDPKRGTERAQSCFALSEDSFEDSILPSYLFDDAKDRDSAYDNHSLFSGTKKPAWNPSLAASGPHLDKFCRKKRSTRAIASPRPELAALETLGPLRSARTRKAAEVYVSDVSPLPYALVARNGILFNKTLIKEAPYTNRHVTVPEQPSYERLIREAVSGKDSALAESYLHKMIIDYYSGASNEAPNGCCYNLVLHAFAAKGDATKSETILKLMWGDYEKGNQTALPNQRCYTSCMHAWQKSNDKARAPEACEKILRDMYRLYDSGVSPDCKPDLFAFTCVFHCWADSDRNDAILRARYLFHQMMERYHKGELDLQPDNVCYSNLINVYIQSDSRNFAYIKEAEGLFWEMVHAYFGGNSTAAPSTRNFNTMLAAFAKISEAAAAEHADAMLRKWHKLYVDGRLPDKPDAFSYSLFLKSWASSSHPQAVARLLEAVEFLRERCQEQDTAARFDTIKYTTVIAALSKHNHALKAHNMLLEMASAYKDLGLKEAKPDVKCFHSVLSAWSRHANSSTAANSAARLLGCLWSIYEYDHETKPVGRTYKALLICCKQAKHAWLAQSTLEEMKRLASDKVLGEPDATSYRLVLETWQRSHDAAKHSQIRLLTQEYKRRFGSVP